MLNFYKFYERDLGNQIVLKFSTMDGDTEVPTNATYNTFITKAQNSYPNLSTEIISSLFESHLDELPTIFIDLSKWSNKPILEILVDKNEYNNYSSNNFEKFILNKIFDTFIDKLNAIEETLPLTKTIDLISGSEEA